MSPASTTPASPLKASVVGGRPPVEAPVRAGDEQAAGEQRVDPLRDRRPRQAGQRGEVAPCGRMAVADELEDRAGGARGARRPAPALGEAGSGPLRTAGSEAAPLPTVKAHKTPTSASSQHNLRLTVDRSVRMMSGVGVARRSGETALRVGIVGAGFIGDVHARAASAGRGSRRRDRGLDARADRAGGRAGRRRADLP